MHIHRLIHPQAIRRMKLDGQPVPDSVVEAIGGFFAVYVVVFVIFMVLAMMDGMDQVTAFGAVATSINNAGPGLGSVAMTFADVSPQGKIMFAIRDAVRPARDLHVPRAVDAGVLEALTRRAARREAALCGPARSSNGRPKSSPPSAWIQRRR